MSKRETLMKLFDHLIFRLDTTKYLFDKPTFDYQPIPWVGIHEAPIRGQATIERWEVMRNILSGQELKSLKDIGCCVGFFCISAAESLKMDTIGIDSNPRFLRIARYATPRELKQKCNFVEMVVTNETVKLLPLTDVSICLSIWHHWVQHYGLDAATVILQEIWNRTNHELFFESGQEEVAEEFNLPFGNESAEEWLTHYLQQTLSGSIVEKTGTFSAGKYPHYQLKDVKRQMFRIHH